jgi:dihydrolipoamide dehydrogenase
MIVVLGGGPAGRFAAMHLASAGKEVQLVERGGIGGQCLYHGCMPVCALGDVARLIRQAQNLAALGVINTVPKVNFPAILLEMQKVQEKIAGILDEETRKAGVTIRYGIEGRLDGHRVFIGNDETEVEAVIAATGSRPRIPVISGAGLEGVFTPHTLMRMSGLPARLTIIGGGIMGAEFAHIFRAFGSEVHIIARGGFLKDLDPHLRTLARKELKEVAIHEYTAIRSIDGGSQVESVAIATGKGQTVLDADAVLLAAGLIPNTECLTGIAKRKNGEVIVDDHMRTSVPGVYACGDVTGPPNLTPVARYEGTIAAENILGRDIAADYRAIPQSLNLFNELAFVNPASDTAASLAIPSPAGPGSFWQVPTGETGLAKLFVEPSDGRITGFCSAAPGGGLIAGYMAFLMRHNFSAHNFEEFIEVHPSTDGVFGLLKYASELLKRQNSS